MRVPRRLPALGPSPPTEKSGFLHDNWMSKYTLKRISHMKRTYKDIINVTQFGGDLQSVPMNHAVRSCLPAVSQYLNNLIHGLHDKERSEFVALSGFVYFPKRSSGCQYVWIQRMDRIVNSSVRLEIKSCKA